MGCLFDDLTTPRAWAWPGVEAGSDLLVTASGIPTESEIELIPHHLISSTGGLVFQPQTSIFDQKPRNLLVPRFTVSAIFLSSQCSIEGSFNWVSCHSYGLAASSHSLYAGNTQSTLWDKMPFPYDSPCLASWVWDERSLAIKARLASLRISFCDLYRSLFAMGS